MFDKHSTHTAYVHTAACAAIVSRATNPVNSGRDTSRVEKGKGNGKSICRAHARSRGLMDRREARYGSRVCRTGIAYYLCSESSNDLALAHNS